MNGKLGVISPLKNMKKSPTWVEEFDKLVKDWKEPEFIFERHNALIDYTSNLIRKIKPFIQNLLDEKEKDELYQDYETLKKMARKDIKQEILKEIKKGWSGDELIEIINKL